MARGRSYRCKDCTNDYRKRPEVRAEFNRRRNIWNARPEQRAKQQARRDQPERKAYMKAYLLRDEVKQKRKEAHKRPEVKARRKAQVLRKCYGLTPDRYAEMVKEQSGCCAICKAGLIGPKVDHSHVTGKVRGILCNTCNLGIGLLNEDVWILSNAIEYLNYHTVTEQLQFKVVA